MVTELCLPGARNWVRWGTDHTGTQGTSQVMEMVCTLIRDRSTQACPFVNVPKRVHAVVCKLYLNKEKRESKGREETGRGGKKTGEKKGRKKKRKKGRKTLFKKGFSLFPKTKISSV